MVSLSVDVDGGVKHQISTCFHCLRPHYLDGWPPRNNLCRRLPFGSFLVVFIPRIWPCISVFYPSGRLFTNFPSSLFVTLFFFVFLFCFSCYCCLKHWLPSCFLCLRPPQRESSSCRHCGPRITEVEYKIKSPLQAYLKTWTSLI